MVDLPEWMVRWYGLIKPNSFANEHKKKRVAYFFNSCPNGKFLNSGNNGQNSFCQRADSGKPRKRTWGKRIQLPENLEKLKEQNQEKLKNYDLGKTGEEETELRILENWNTHSVAQVYPEYTLDQLNAWVNALINRNSIILIPLIGLVFDHTAYHICHTGSPYHTCHTYYS